MPRDGLRDRPDPLLHQGDIAPRLVLALIAATASLALGGLAIGVANTLSAGLLGQPLSGDASSEIGTLVLAQLGGDHQRLSG